MRCTDECPTGAIRANEALRRTALLHTNMCDGCDMCRSSCQFDAIRGDLGKAHSMSSWDCTGCGQCVPACPHEAIELIPTIKYSRH